MRDFIQTMTIKDELQLQKKRKTMIKLGHNPYCHKRKFFFLESWRKSHSHRTLYQIGYSTFTLVTYSTVPFVKVKYR